MRVVSSVLLFALSLWVAATGTAADEKKSRVDICWPETVVTDPPVPAPQPVSNRLVGDMIQDVKCSDEVYILVSPAGAVKVTQEKVEAGQTLKYRGRFTDGSTNKSWTGPCVVYFLEANAVKDGVVVTLIPYGFKSSNEVVQKVLDVDNLGARPPPGPVVDPVVDPVVKKASKITVVICENLIERTPTQAKVINDPKFRAFVKDTGGSVELLSTKDPKYAANNFKEYGDKVGLPLVAVFDADATGPTAPLTFFKLTESDPAELTSRIGKVVKK